MLCFFVSHLTMVVHVNMVGMVRGRMGDLDEFGEFGRVIERK
jgi:hypothetical protein